ncbi:type-F conjugative transfer system secretin TraK [Burkholderia cenocepacia]|jgi:conjugal transfer pilus assembly protein TraK|uniref:type-F conjugative transfer system secretin TraK n=1 Tax=Burkholderia cenocepacia TaxID=95486 RepID=UPI0024B85E27|nr:type-F conjugative transfer system secretin TraK [Burkholderia cenocepacia]MDI9689973.1 type-F conjugative transfer system secretin TraK [Burkholderia cenocepacia]
MGPVELRANALRLALAFVLSSGIGSANALQVIDTSDGASVEAILSIQEPTRIRIEGAPITDVFGNIYSSGCATPPTTSLPAGMAASPAGANPQAALPVGPSVNPTGEIVIECDRDKGEIYVRPVGDGKKPINLFVSSAKGTYTLLLRRADTPADTIVIRDKAALQRRADATAPRPAPGSAASHVRSLKALLVAMATERAPSDIQVEDVAQAITLWREARFTLERTYRGRGLVGERYVLQNVSEAPMVLTEQEFDREDDEAGGVAGVAIEHHNLRPGERTLVFVIRREVQP